MKKERQLGRNGEKKKLRGDMERKNKITTLKI